MKKILFAAMGAVMLAAVSGAWAEDKAGAEARKSLQELQEVIALQEILTPLVVYELYH